MPIDKIMNFLKPQCLTKLLPTSWTSLCTPSFYSSVSTDLEVILKIIHQEGHMISQAPLDRICLVGFEVLALHLQGPAVLQFSLYPAHTQ